MALNYTNYSNTYFATPKSDVKDKIALEVGDSKQPDFKPQEKIMRISWMKGRKHSEESKEKMRQSHLGKIPSMEQRRKQSEALKGRIPKNLSSLDNSGAKSHWWKGGVSTQNELDRKGKEYRFWRISVFNRDDYTCKKCGKRSRAGDRINLHPHHIKNFSVFIGLRFEIENGVTFCEKCHRKFHKIYGLNSNDENQLKEFLCQK